MSKKSAGLLMYRGDAGGLEVLLAHPGGPFWAKKDEGVWSIPKGEFSDNEDPLAAAGREFEEETGMAPRGDFIPLTPLRQQSGKVVFAWAVQGDFNPASLTSNVFSLEWPPGSGRMREFPEVDRAEWLTLEAAMRKILPGQAPFLRELAEKLDRQSRHPGGTG